MATTNLESLRQGLNDRLGTCLARVEYNTTTNITTSVDVVSTELVEDGYENDDELNDKWIIITGTNNARVVRRIEDYTGSSGTIAVRGGNLAAESGSVTFEVMNVHPLRMERALRNGLRRSFPLLHRVIVDETLFTGTQQHAITVPTTIIGAPSEIWVGNYIGADASGENILDDGGFESWASATSPTYWTGTNITTTRETQTYAPRNVAVLRDTYSLQGRSTASTAGTLYDSISSPTTYVGLELNFGIWVYYLGTAANDPEIKPAIKLDSTTSEGTAHSGGGWERLTHTYDIEPADPTSFTLDVGLTVSSASNVRVFYADEAFCTVGQQRVADIPWTKLLNWKFENGIVRFPYRLYDVRPMRVVGMGYLSQPTTETGTTEIGDPQTELAYSYAAEEIFRMMMRQNVMSNKGDARDLLRDCLLNRDALRSQVSMASLATHRLGPDWGR